MGPASQETLGNPVSLDHLGSEHWRGGQSLWQPVLNVVRPHFSSKLCLGRDPAALSIYRVELGAQSGQRAQWAVLIHV